MIEQTRTISLPRRVTFEQLRQRAANALEKAQRSGNLESTRATDAVATLSEVAELATTQKQRERYGVEQWHRDFVIIPREIKHEIRENGQGNLVTGNELLRQLFGIISHTRFGRIQRAYTENHSIIVPRELVSSFQRRLSNKDLRELRARYDQIPISGVLLSPDLLPNSFVQAVELISWPPNCDKKEAIVLKNTPRTIDAVKQALDTLEKVHPLNSRIWRFGPLSAEIRLRYNLPDGAEAKCEGGFLYFRSDNATQPRYSHGGTQKKTDPDLFCQREIPSYFRSVYDLYRATSHKQTGYEAEVDRLATLQEKARALNVRLGQQWKVNTPVDQRQELKSHVLKFIGEASEAFLGVQTGSKKEAAQLLQELREKINTTPTNENTVVPNMMARLLQLVAVRNRLQERAIDIPRKSRWNESDRLHIQEYIKAQETVFAELAETLAQAPSTLDREEQYFRSTSSDSDAKSSDVATGILMRLNLGRERLNPITARPFTTFAKAIRMAMTDVEQGVFRRDRHEVEKALVKLVILSKLAAANACLERMKRFVAYGDVGFDTFEKITKDLSRILDRREVYPNTRVPEYQEVYTPLQRKFRRMNERFAELAKTDLSDDERAEKFAAIREFLNKPENDIESAVAGISGVR